MGRIELHDGTVTRTIPADGIEGVVEIDWAGDEPIVTLPPGVEVRRSDTATR